MAGALVAGCSSGGNGDAETPTSAADPVEIVDTTEVAEVLRPPEWQPATRNEELAWEVSSSPSGPSVQHAVDSFGLVVRDFPGVTPTDLPIEDERSGTYALRLIESVRADLTDEQVAALDAHRADGETVATRSGDGSIELAMPGTVGRGRTASPEIAKYSELFAEVIDGWAAHLPAHPKHDAYELQFSKSNATGMEADETTSPALTCIVRVHPSFRASDPADDEIRFYFAHELFHCMQFRWSAPASMVMPHKWVWDGSADWAAADLYRDYPITFNDIRPGWFSFASMPLSAREYGAWPLFENANLNLYSTYELIKTMFAEPRHTVAAQLAVGHLDGLVFRMQWSSRTLRQDGWGDDWEMDWVWKGHEESGPKSNTTKMGQIAPGASGFGGVGEFAQPQLQLTMTSQVGLLTVSPLGSPLTTRTAVGTRTVGDGSSGRFCFHPGGCACPGGTTSDAWPMDGPEMIFSFAASEEQPITGYIAEEWDPDEHCKPEPQPKDAESNGDPHLVSFDGLAYDVVTLGEFVLARDPTGDLEVQTRHVPFGFGAGTTAVALTDGEHRLTFTLPVLLTGEPPTVRVDGDVVTELGPTVGDLRLAPGDGDIAVVWPDGSTVSIQWFLGWFVRVTVPAERAARMEGLLGALDGDLRNDLRLPDGTVVDTTDAEAYDSAYALSWAVDESTTLFDYEPGESPATFRIPHPQPVVPPLDLDALADCEAALGDAAAGHEVESCAFDVTATGEEGFISEYVEVVDERLDGPELAEPFDLPDDTAPDTTASAVETQAGEPTLTLAAGEVGTVDAAAGTIVLARAASCPEGVFVDLVVWRSDDPDLMTQGTLCDPQELGDIGLDSDDEWFNGEAYVWIPGDGAYEIGVDVFLGDAESFESVDVFLDPAPGVLDAAALVDGDRSTLESMGDTIVYLADPESVHEAVGFDVACAVEVYWGDVTFPDPQPRKVACRHTDQIRFPPTDTVVPMVVFRRTGEPVVVEVGPPA